MKARKETPQIISGEDYHRYHPGKVMQNSADLNLNGLYFTEYTHPNLSEKNPRPATSDHILAFGFNGGVKGEYSYHGSKWRPYTWYAKEWFIGQAFENARDSHEKSICSEDVELSVCYLHLSPQLLKKVALEVADCESFELPHKIGFRDDLMYQLGCEIKTEIEGGSPYKTVFIETAAQLLSVHLLKNYSTTYRKIPEYNGKKNANKIQRVIDYIYGHLNEELSLEIMASIAHLSSYHFIRTFKEVVGVSPHQFILNARVELAKEQLKKTNKAINIIALELGYTDSYFVKLFKRYTGTTPYQYRRIAQR